MIWLGKGKHEGKDVNDVPIDYIEWAARDSKNPTTKAQAEKILAYRNSGNGTPKTSAGASSEGATGAGPRAKALELAIMMDNKNPWPYIKATLDYIQTGQLPDLASMLGGEPPEQDKKKDDPFVLDDTVDTLDEPPF